MKQGNPERSETMGDMPMKKDMSMKDMKMGKSSYLMFAANLLASGIVMYFVMYTMIDSPADSITILIMST